MKSQTPSGRDVHWRISPTARVVASATRRSLYLPMPDGVRIAVDVHVPEGARARKVPTILRQTRYFRALKLRQKFLSRLGLASVADLYVHARERFLDAGFAWIDVDVRGSGASFGSRPYPWAPEEVRDGACIVDWILAQPWSNGLVGSLGVSYDGTCAEFLRTTKHPGVRAVAPMFALYDVYADVAFPGGAHLGWFTGAWSRFNTALDANNFALAAGMAARLELRGKAPPADALRSAVVREIFELTTGAKENFPLLELLLERIYDGVKPVDEDADGRILSQAIAAHADHFDIHEGALRTTYRDDHGLSSDRPDVHIDAFSPHAFTAGNAEPQGCAIYSISGWRDAAYPHSAIKRFASVPSNNSRLLLGPWGHGGMLSYAPHEATQAASFDLYGELLDFFRLHLQGEEQPMVHEPRVHYFTTGENRWQSSERWPPRDVQETSLFFTREGTLSPIAPEESSLCSWEEPHAMGTGERSRWRTLLGGKIQADYPDWTERTKQRWTFVSPPLDRSMELTGHARLQLRLRTLQEDAVLYAYLSDQAPDGSMAYITEGELRLLHRNGVGKSPAKTPGVEHSFLRKDATPWKAGEEDEVLLGFLPTSHVFARGHRLCVSLALSDVDHFYAFDGGTRRGLAVWMGGNHGAQLFLPL